MIPLSLVQRITSEYEAHRNPEKAVKMAAYMKNLFPFLGIQTPEREALSKPIWAEITPFVTEPWLVEVALLLWEKDQREYQYAALSLLSKQVKLLSPVAMPAIEHLITHKSWWDTVDTIASRLVGSLVFRFPELLPTLEQYSTHDNLWLRRTAILHQLSYKQNTDAERLWRYCTLNADSKEFFIQKAIGWALREYSKTNRNAVVEYIQRNEHRLSNLSKREGLKRI
ncbi:DNA alkylation repair protein [Kovacikia minuta CCNUW1]|uniref:DNA alkylation repair protein n=1 Tax=Kovacikia minuta TaxID=2931930 RepID=UPI001CCA9D0F|nr:DNA alkylation repair protein [Kovacikia minuta]UBF26323.1 DNA alkylation repair protein [Kovacikia minuta CCNUW1]